MATRAGSLLSEGVRAAEKRAECLDFVHCTWRDAASQHYRFRTDIFVAIDNVR